MVLPCASHPLVSSVHPFQDRIHSSAVRGDRTSRHARADNPIPKCCLGYPSIASGGLPVHREASLDRRVAPAETPSTPSGGQCTHTQTRSEHNREVNYASKPIRCKHLRVAPVTRRDDALTPARRVRPVSSIALARTNPLAARELDCARE